MKSDNRIDKELYILEGSHNGTTWVQIQEIPHSHLPFKTIATHAQKFRFLRSRSLLTNEIIVKVVNVQR